MALDTIDLRILRELQDDCGVTNVQLAERVNLSPSPCLYRVRRLEEAGYIDRRVAILNPVLLGLTLNVFVSVSLANQNRESLREFETLVCSRDEVMECYLMTGDSDYLLRVMMPDIVALERFIVEVLSPIPVVQQIRSSFALKQIRYNTALPLPART